MGKASRRKLERRSTPTPETLLHGGRAGLGVGDVLLPAMLVPAERELLTAGMSAQALHEYGPNRVWLTTDYDLALAYAARAGVATLAFRLEPSAGAIYRVRVATELHQDPDYPEGISYGTKRAVIEDVIRDDVAGSWTAPTAAGLRFDTWDDGSRMYDDDGFPLPSLTALELGVRPQDLRQLGFGAEHEKINAASVQRMRSLHPNITPAEVDRIRRRHHVNPDANWRETKKD